MDDGGMEGIKTSAGGVEASLRRFSGCSRSKLTSLLLSFPDSLFFLHLQHPRVSQFPDCGPTVPPGGGG